jgi:hypothetical protein
LDPARIGYGNARLNACVAAPYANLKAGDILLLHDGTSARDFDGQPVVLKVLPVLLERLARDRLSLFPSRRKERASRFHRWGYNDRC